VIAQILFGHIHASWNTPVPSILHVDVAAIASIGVIQDSFDSIRTPRFLNGHRGDVDSVLGFNLSLSHCYPLKPHLWRLCAIYQPASIGLEASSSDIARWQLGVRANYAEWQPNFVSMPNYRESCESQFFGMNTFKPN